MRILLLHNYYQISGGEDIVLEQEANLLRQKGHSVKLVTVTNDDILAETLWQRIHLGVQTIWSWKGYRLVRTAIQDFKPDILHVHNFFPLLSPSIYWATHHAGIPVVQTLHNYRLVCANALLLRNEHPCELCIGRKVPLPALRYRCYRNNLMATLSLTGMQIFHRLIGTFRRKATGYIILSNFSRQIFIRGGLPESNLYIKSNFIPDPSANVLPISSRKKQIVCVGRISPGKGLELLLEAWQSLRPENWRLVIVGDGPERVSLQERFRTTYGVHWLGWLGKQDALRITAQSMIIVIASQLYEGAFPLVGIEAFSTGTPIIAPNHGSFPEAVTNDTGWLFEAGNVADLANRLKEAIDLKDTEWTKKSQLARRTYEQNYIAESNYQRLIEIYKMILKK